MKYKGFDKSLLINLKKSLYKEFLLTNRSGAYQCTTLSGCNTRKYHGLLVCPVEAFGRERFVLLSSLDISLVKNGREFNLGIHQYANDHFFPNGHKYLNNFSIQRLKQTEYCIGDNTLLSQCLFVKQQEQIINKYTLKEATAPITLRFKPLLAFRNIHELTHANLDANTRAETIENGVKYRLYENFPYLHLQFNTPPEYIHVPQWYYGIEYKQEYLRGYDYQEDLLCPGYFDIELRKGESIFFSAATQEVSGGSLPMIFEDEIPNEPIGYSLLHYLKKASKQFIISNSYGSEVIAGYPWFGSIGRNTFIALSGLTQIDRENHLCESILDTMVNRMQEGLFPNFNSLASSSYNSADAPLWFIWAIQQYNLYSDVGPSEIWKKYSTPLKTILKDYKQGTSYNIKMQENGLIYAGQEGKALTWMDSVVDKVPVTPRIGYPVEINALWYNGIKFCLELAYQNQDNDFINEWEDISKKIAISFQETFWNENKQYLADNVLPPFKDWSVRPNQIIAAALQYTPLSRDQQKAVVDMVKKELLTPRGLRTLSPNHESYMGEYNGNQPKRDQSYHQGSVWPWLLEPFCRAYLNIYQHKALPLLQKIYTGFEEEMEQHGIGTISELFDGDPPHKPGGAISYACSISALLQIHQMIQEAKHKY